MLVPPSSPVELVSTNLTHQVFFGLFGITNSFDVLTCAENDAEKRDNFSISRLEITEMKREKGTFDLLSLAEKDDLTSLWS